MEKDIVKNCSECGKQFTTIYSYQITCSTECRLKRNRNLIKEQKKRYRGRQKNPVNMENTGTNLYAIFLTRRNIETLLTILATSIAHQELTPEQSIDIINITLRISNATIKNTENAISS